MNSEIDQYIAGAPEEQRAIMTKVREILQVAIPDVTEEYKWSRPVFKKHKDFAYLKKAKAYVTLGFYRFENINDLEQLLEGTGKDMRHIKLKKLSDLDRIPLASWFQAVAE